ncbi:helix-turn-helix transcriptional regulator [Labedella endophytica]|uniref:HTH luxR-type domain-containing protein n=1 Tax=Labedella endophytica TaxID=1523160 RepID=A0A3S0XDL1_9MICO|nr:LuxR C-terminal-related transcriptional regulator [Labedella endophytica]RUR03431.1 hypothetical protein ELQ94_02495 [Labedella endophytica]
MIYGAPRPGEREIARPRLEGLLSSGHVVIVRAGRGAGKTTSVASWARNTSEHGAWITVDADIAARAAFWTRTLGFLSDACPISHVTGVAEFTVAPDVRRSLAAWALGVQEDLTVVVDDVDHADPLVFADLMWFATLSQRLRVVVTTRPDAVAFDSMPRGAVLLGNEELSLSAQEASSLMRSHGIDVGPGDDVAAALVRLTVGAPSAISAVARGGANTTLRQADVEPSPARWILDVILRDALAGRPLLDGGGDAELIAVAALFDGISVAELSRIVEESDETVRDALHRAANIGYGSWTTEIDGRFRVLPAVRADRTGSVATVDPVLIARAAALHARRGESFEAVTLAIANGDFTAATEYGMDSFVSLLRDHSEPLLAQLSAVPLSALSAHPLLVLFLAMLHARAPRGRRAMLAHYARAEFLSRAGSRNARATDRAVILIVRSAMLRLTGRGEAARNVARQSLDALDAASPVEAEGLGALRGALLGQATLAFFAAGDMAEARDLSARKATLDGAGPQMRHSAWTRSAFIEGVWGDIDGARERLEATAGLEGWPEKFFVVPAVVTRAMLAVEEGDFDSAETGLRDLGSRLQEVEYWPAGVVLQAFVRIAAGRSDRALDLLDAAEGNPGAIPVSRPARRILLEARAFTHVSAGRIGDARLVMRRLSSAERKGSIVDVIIRLVDDEPIEAIAAASAGLEMPRSERAETMLRILRATAALRLGYRPAAERDFRRALERLRTVGLGSAWAVVPARDRDAVDAVVREVGDAEIVDRLSVFPSLIPDLPRYAALTRRERLVIAGVVDGLTNAEISVRLGVSPNTVKKQRASAYGKLGASTREEAIEAALARGLLDGE